MRILVRRLPQTLCAAMLAGSSPALATYSLIAADSANGEMGGFVISCVGNDFELEEVLRLGDNSVVVAQGYFFEVGRDAILLELSQGAAPQDALATALSPTLDPPEQSSGPSYRQYAALTVDGAIAQHSGSDLSSFAGDQSGSVGTLTYALQGNILTSSSVLDQLEAGFLAPQATIAERSISALRALADSGGGDSRCSPLSGDAGHFVQRAAGAPSLEISVRSLEAGEEVARVLALSIEAKVFELSGGVPPGDATAPSEETEPTIPNEETEGRPRAGTPHGCNYSQWNGAAPVLWVCLAGLLLSARRRPTSRRS